MLFYQQKLQRTLSVICDVKKVRLKSISLSGFSFLTSPFIPLFQTYFYDVTHDTFQRFKRYNFIRKCIVNGTSKVVNIEFENIYLQNPIALHLLLFIFRFYLGRMSIFESIELNNLIYIFIGMGGGFNTLVS